MRRGMRSALLGLVTVALVAAACTRSSTPPASEAPNISATPTVAPSPAHNVDAA